MKQKYELMIIISSQISDPEIEKRVQGIKDFLGDEVVYEEVWGVRPFAYPIKKQHKGHYVVWNFMADVAGVQHLEESLKLYPDLLRHLIVKVPENYTPLSIKEVDAQLEELREEKASKRSKPRSAKKDGDKKPAPKAAPAPAPEKKEAAPEAKEAAPAAAEAPAESSAPATEEKAEEAKPADEKDGKKTLDEKLDSILSDKDLGL